MTMRGEGSDHVVVGGDTFGMPSLGRGGKRSARFGYGGGLAAPGNPFGGLTAAKAALDGLNTTVRPNVDTSGLDAVAGQLDGILGKINALRGGVTVPVTIAVSGSAVARGAQPAEISGVRRSGAVCGRRRFRPV